MGAAPAFACTHNTATFGPNKYGTETHTPVKGMITAPVYARGVHVCLTIVVLIKNYANNKSDKFDV